MVDNDQQNKTRHQNQQARQDQSQQTRHQEIVATLNLCRTNYWKELLALKEQLARKTAKQQEDQATSGEQQEDADTFKNQKLGWINFFENSNIFLEFALKGTKLISMTKETHLAQHFSYL